MKIAIYGRRFDNSFNKSLILFFEILKKLRYEIIIFASFYDFIKKQTNFDPKPSEIFTGIIRKSQNISLIFSIGGDGTFLECVSFIRASGIPIIGINSGRLGFLANISKDEIASALPNIHEKKYQIQERTLIKLKSNRKIFEDFNCGLNEITVQKRDTGSMITVDVFLNGDFLNSYWADGLIISTPTGSTAYSLSAGGPIVVPDSQTFIITPIAPHNLTVRPMIVPDNNKLTIKIKSRSKNCLVSLDYRSAIVKTPIEFKIMIANFKIKTIIPENKTFFDTLRNKLMWGIDVRTEL